MLKLQSDVLRNPSVTSVVLKALLFFVLFFVPGINLSLSYGQSVPTYTITLSDSVSQPVTGWGCFPGFVDWGARIGYDRSLQKALYGELGMTVGRVKIYPQYCNRDGSLNTHLIDIYLAREVETMRSYGITNWIITTWSPPVFMKTLNDTIGNVNGQPNHLKPEFEDAFVKFYARVLVYLRDVKKLGTPVYATVQNEPDYAAPWDGCLYEPEQWRRVTKKLRKALDEQELTMVMMHGPDPMDMLAFVGKGKTVVLLTNPTPTARKLKIKGLTGTSAELFRTSTSEDMADTGSQPVAKGETTVLLPGTAVLILETNGGK